MLFYFKFVKYNRKEFFKVRFFSRSSKIVHENEIKLKEIECFALMNKPLFPGLCYVLNADKSIIKNMKNYKQKKTYIGLFFNRKRENEETFSLFSDAELNRTTLKIKENEEEKKKLIRKDIDYIRNLSDIYNIGCIGLIKEILYDENTNNSTQISNDNLSKIRINNNRDSNNINNNDINNDNLFDKNINKESVDNNRNFVFNKFDNVFRIVVELIEKIKIKNWKGNNMVEFDIIKNEKYDINNKYIKIYHIEIINKIKEIISLNSVNNYEYNLLLKYYNIKNINNLVNFIGNITINKNSAIQELFESNNIEEKLKKCLHLLNEDIFLLKMKKELTNDLNEKFLKEKKELIIKEYINSLKKKICQKSDHEAICENFLNKFNTIKSYLNIEATTIISREINKFLLYNENCNEYSSTYQYLNTVLSIPYNKYQLLNEDINECEILLNKSHYGLNYVKKYILEYLSLYILNKNIKPKILLLVGYPGTGKTSICKSISKCLNIPFYVINMNNINNMNDLIGHRKTYVNSYEGKIIQSLISTNVMNPLIILDEFDKISYINTNIYNTFLNIFDINQNKLFKDQYINIPVDISNVFFICTVNTIENIPDVLLDRMEIINIHPYTNIEKVHIFRNYLKKKLELETKITDIHLHISDELLLYIIHNYTNENGLRQFYNIIYNIYKKRAYLLLKGNTKEININLNNLNDFINIDSIKNKKNKENHNFDGSLKSLAFTDNGGQIVTIEVSSLKNNFSLKNRYPKYEMNYVNNDEFYCNYNEHHYSKLKNYNSKNDKNDNNIENYNHHNANNKYYNTRNNKYECYNNEYYNTNNINSLIKEKHEKSNLPFSISVNELALNDKNQIINYYNLSEMKNSLSSSDDNKNIYKKNRYELLDKNDNELKSINENTCLYENNSFSFNEDKYSYSNGFNKKKDIHLNNENRFKNDNFNYNIIITGNVGKIMQESIIIANTYSINLMNQIIPNFQNDYLHINLSECDIKKDGPSAGINFVTSILSYYLKIAVDNSLCMTGEISLNGHILKIGGLIEKVIVAKNYGIRTLIIPRDNAQEYELLPSYIKENINVLYVYHYCQIFNMLFNKYNKYLC
ncbi:ATP-dependent protease, putative [Plasmodium gallinaceum]|uniref:ATP-dependent protease, putative n=1 Tax=Plasmodium gallinaceum TaxID=5849 RepID=A0A1J1GT35_PLAGA|nr:ATP-dependent protease, putative [Plasmodium gallinaceum]CRG95668.1 ATP-dependent protease, putative [Plasmodium gallinaceum]